MEIKVIFFLFMVKKMRLSLSLLLLLLWCSCGTFKLQSSQDALQLPQKEVAHTFYLIGDAGNAGPGESTPALIALGSQVSKAPESSTTLFLGDNIYEYGMPEEGAEDRAAAEHRLNSQIEAVSTFKGRTIFIPGNHDWYNGGLKGLKAQEKYIEDRLGKNSFLPENGCPLVREKISDDINLLILDSQWFMEDWNNHPTINDKCDQIKTREQFFDEVESEIKKAEGKTLVIAIHHPIATNGVHGGKFSFYKHLYPFQSPIPLPVIGSVINYIRLTSGVSNADLQNKYYTELSRRLFTLVQGHDNVVFVSGHEHNLQYIVSNDTPVIISGAGSKSSPAALGADGVFTYGKAGFAKLTVFKDGSSWVEFYGMANDFESPLFSKEVLSVGGDYVVPEFPDTFPEQVEASVYNEEDVQKSKLYTSFWGDHYRKEYGEKIEVKTAVLDTLFGGLIPVRKGGGHQSKSLRLEDREGKEYVMRAVKKSAVRFLQSVVFKDRYVADDFTGSVTEKLLLDFYTAAHPYAGLTVAEISEAISVLHTNPVLYFIPKHNALGKYNQDFGDELYVIEERVDSGHGELASFANADEIISTKDMLEKLRRKDDNKIDEALYIRSRLLDMLLGDWDRHEDQWRWAETDLPHGKKLYKPIPRDRDQVFSNFDGFFVGALTRLIPSLRLMQTYDEEIRNLKWFNDEPFPLDMAVLTAHTREDWINAAEYIQSHLTPEVIDKALEAFPKEVQNENRDRIRKVFLARKDNLRMIAEEYYELLKRNVVVSGTDKDDWFLATREADGSTRLEGYRNKGGEKKDRFLHVAYNPKETEEVWIYALDDDDIFEVKGDGPAKIKLRLLGGQNNDIYRIENRKKVIAYDYRSKPNTFETPVRKNITDDYNLHVYEYTKVDKHVNTIMPLIGYNPDDGVMLGASYSYTHYGVNRAPYSQLHRLKAAYFFATQGFALNYSGEITRVFGNWNFGADAVFTSPNFSINYFGFGNESENDTDRDMDYNRVRLSTIRLYPKLIWRGHNGGHFSFGPLFESIEVEGTVNRFVNTGVVPDEVFEYQNFTGLESIYGYENFNDPANPSQGMGFEVKGGYKLNTGNSDSFFYVIPQLRFTSPIGSSDRFVFATKFKGHFNIGNNFQFYQGAMIGGVDGLRGFRNQRFNGRTAYYQNTDLRWNITKVNTGILPCMLGVFGGFDYGRVWVDDDPSRRWHSSVGGGLYMNALSFFTANISYFNSADGNRISFALAYNF
ncbi:metallophosphoesterase [Robertkochia solimangrovi]|uniref:metallophosphoesterase n=1 Tax=Robertkochia solimangrovi TaxID=2213046 RepID=UPI00117C46B0|nr:metallophosphoesterase [Robertkochia solimangrovi]TRZ41886.1 phosphoesterase [Robertkochia solimangrovi]